MDRFKGLLIGIDFTEFDANVIRYTEFISNLSQPEKIYFIHVHNSLDLPEEVRKELSIEEPLDEYLKDEMKQVVANNFTSHQNFDIEYMVVEGAPFPQMLHWVKVKEVDLTILGKKNSKGSGVFLTRFTRRTASSVLIIPEKAETVLDTILVCNDFSVNSELSTQKALEFAHLIPNSTVYSQHIFNVPVGFHKSGKSFDEVAAIMKKHAITRYREFEQNIENPDDVYITPIFTLNKKSDPATLVQKTADSMQAKMVIVGSKGRTFAASIFLGSFAECLVREQADVPLLVIKRKNENMDVIDALKNI